MSHALRVFFAHQSVGAGIVEGLRAEGLTGIELSDRLVGSNGAPLTKLAAFEQAVTELNASLDVALLKLCYADFTPATDVGALFNAYQRTIARLTAAFPRLVFAHVTVPLTVVQGGWRATVKRWAGMSPWGELENLKRDTFNRKLRREYASTPLFDLALIESTRADGTSEVDEVGGVTVPKLRADFTDDGGHLNTRGRTVAARAMLALLRTIEPLAP